MLWFDAGAVRIGTSIEPKRGAAEPGLTPRSGKRRKLGDDAARPAYVLTERGVGYRIATLDDR